MQLLTIPVGAARGVVDDKTAVLVAGCLLAGLLAVITYPTQGYPQSGQQFVDGEGLGQVIVRTSIQRGNFVTVIRAGRYHDDGHIAPGADLFDDVDTVHVRQAKIQQHHVRPVRKGIHHRLGAVPGPTELVILGLQCGGDQIADGCIILYKQNLRLIHMRLPPKPAG